MSVCMFVCMYHCFKMKWYDFYNAFVRGPVPLDLALAIYRGNWNLTLTASRIIICDIPFMRSHEARPYTVPPKSELWGVNSENCCTPSQNFRQDTWTVSPSP